MSDYINSDYVNSKYIEVKKALIKKAVKGKSTYYSELMEKFDIPRWWIGRILFRVADSCLSNKEPIITALVEYKSGGIGAGYNELIKKYGADRDYKKEQEKCFKYWKNKNR